MKRLLLAGALAAAGATLAQAQPAHDPLRPLGAAPLPPVFQGSTADRPFVRAQVLAQVLAQASPTSRQPGADSGGVGGGEPVGNLSASEFARRAAMNNMLEQETAQLALERSQNDRVRRYADEMLTAHKQAAAELQRIARGATSVQQLEGLHADMLQTLRSAPAQQFDEAFVAMQIQAHQRAIELFQAYAENGEDAQLRQWARQKLPTLEDHLKSAENITRVGLR